MPQDPVLCAIEDGVAVVTLNNPPLNLVTLEMTRRLNDTVKRLADDPAVRVMVLTGAGDKAFCAGSDIKEFPEMMAAGAVVPKKLALENEAWSRVDDFPKPTIAAVSGLAFGGGLELAVCCDLIVAEEGARVALPEIKLGVFPGSGGTIRVTRRIGEGRAKEMMFFGEPLRSRPRSPGASSTASCRRERRLPPRSRWQSAWRRSRASRCRCASAPSTSPSTPPRTRPSRPRSP